MEEAKIANFTSERLKNKILNRDTKVSYELEFEPEEKTIFKNTETIDFAYSRNTINMICKLAFYSERINLGNFTLFKIFWDILKFNFWKLTNENKTLFLKCLCESNLNLLFFEKEILELYQRHVASENPIVWEHFQKQNDTKIFENPEFNLILENFNVVHSAK